MNKVNINVECNIDNSYSSNKAYVYAQYGKEPSIFSLYEPDNIEMTIKTKFIDDLIIKSNILNKKYSNELPIKLNPKHIHNFRDSLFLEYNINSDENMYIYISYAESINDSISLITNKKLPKFINATFVIYYNHTNSVHLEELENIIQSFNKNVTFYKNQKDHSYINLVVQENNQIKLKSYTIKSPEIDLELSYGIEFAELYPSIVDGLAKETKGLWIFHSTPGMGKTMLTRKIIAEVNELLNDDDDARIIYLPSEMVKLLEDPSFIPFISDYPGSILVIEDADVALQSREQYGQIVQTVLNLTDGILSDCLKIKILATFNCNLDKIDTALLRKGRLQLRHEFLNVPQDRAIELAKKLNLDSELLLQKSDWSLADIYNLDKNPEPLIKKKAKIGFGA